MKERNPRILLARLREGDYAHPGDTEAIDIFLEYLMRFQHPNFNHILDVGCGRGGTAEYVRQHLSPLLINGIDIDAQAIQYAQDHYPQVVFHHCNVNVIEQIGEQKFDLIYIFSVLYGFDKSLQQTLFHKLAQMAQPGAIIAISDYILLDEDESQIVDFAHRPMCPPSIQDLKKELNDAGWEVIGEYDLLDKYQHWYKHFLQRLDAEEENLLLEFEQETIQIVRNTFQTILNKINDKIWSGSLIYAKLKNPTLFKNVLVEDDVPDIPVYGDNKTS